MEENSNDEILLKKWIRNIRDYVIKSSVKNPDLNFDKIWNDAISTYSEPKFEDGNPLDKRNQNLEDLKIALSEITTFGLESEKSNKKFEEIRERINQI